MKMGSDLPARISPKPAGLDRSRSQVCQVRSLSRCAAPTLSAKSENMTAIPAAAWSVPAASGAGAGRSSATYSGRVAVMRSSPITR